MRSISHAAVGVILALCLAVSGDSQAGHGRCAHCGCADPCQKVCRLVCEEKKVEVVCWGMKCEDFCLPCPSKPGCEHSECVCQDCEAAAAGICTVPQKFVWSEWCPRGAKMFTKTKLMKKVETKTVPSYKWVVEDLCSGCCAKQKGNATP